MRQDNLRKVLAVGHISKAGYLWHTCIHESSPAQHQALLQIGSLVAGPPQEEKQVGELQRCPPAGEIKLKQ